VVVKEAKKVILMIPSRNSTLKGKPRPAYTLNEMLIVVAVIGALTAVAFPMLRKPLAKHQLRAAAKQLRAELARTRLQAIEQGETLQFRFVPGGNSYRVEPLDVAHSEDASIAGAASMVDDVFDFQSSQEQADEVIETVDSNAAQAEQNAPEDLPEDIRFAEADERAGVGLGLADEVTAAHLLERSEGSDDMELFESADWSEPIVFYPNGRTSNGEIELVGDREYRIRLTLRGVTGAIEVSPLERPPEDDLEVDVSTPAPTRVAARPARGSDRSRLSPSPSLFRGSIHGIPTSRAPSER
jgi:Tfp pilus assembly protein FimT